MKIDEMQAGRELDALIGKEVMGLDVEPSSNYDGWFGDLIPIGDREFIDPQGWVYNNGKKPLPNYSTDIAAAWQVLCKLSDYFHVERYPDAMFDIAPPPPTTFTYACRIGGGSYSKSTKSDTAPLAICRAALKAIDYKE